MTEMVVISSAIGRARHIEWPSQTSMASDPTHTGQSTTTSPGLLLTTADTIAFIYPKEMGYENDYLHAVFKLNLNSTSAPSYRIEDSVYDNRTWSIYFILSAVSTSNSSTGSTLQGSSLIRIKQHHRRLKQPAQHQMVLRNV